jgi:class 3 adenylate cyclase/tetratricopeptide (TPR) repeat protein
MQCSSCHHENPSGQKFCGNCGARLVAVCASCGTVNPPQQKFCGDCGSKLGAGSNAALAESPASYTPRHLADNILISRTAIEGERKQVTVLFADLTGSMELLADRDPEQARAILDPVLGQMMDAVHAYDGTVNQVMGDGIMALFGAPLAQEDHAVRACYAALALQSAIRQYSEEMRVCHGVAIQVRIGINSGEVLVRSIGSDLKMDYSAIGQTTHLASRMEQLAAAGSILITNDTLRLAEGFVQVRSLGPVPVKGLPAPVETFELTGALTRRSRLQARAASGGLTRFVGRQVEVAVLARAANSAREHKGQAVAIVGEAGVGKSRLFWEFTHSHHVQSFMVLEASSTSHGKASSFLPVIDLVKSYCEIGERDDTRSVKEKLTGKLLTLDRRLEPLLPPLLALLHQPVDDKQWAQLDPPQKRRQILEALKQLWLREAKNQPLILVFEDLHWIDSETQTFLNEMLDKVPASPILLLFNYRPEYQHPWGSKTFYTQLRLDALPVENVDEFLVDLVGSDPSVEPLKKTLLKRGNPLFLEESVRTLVETGKLVGKRGDYRLTEAVDILDIPATVQTMLAARIDRLEAEDKRLLQTASVIGKDVPFELLKAIADIGEAKLTNALVRLQAAEFVYEAGLYPDVEYTFKHALTHEVAYGELTHDRRRAIHARIVDAIETVYANRVEDHVERLAHHAFRGEVWEKAVKYLREAGQRAFARSANVEAVKLWEQALEATDQLPEGQNRARQAIDTRLDLRGPLLAIGQISKTLKLSQQALTLAELSNDHYRTAMALAHQVAPHYFACNLNEGIAAWAHAMEIATEEGYTDAQVIASTFLPMMLFMRGEGHKSEKAFHENIARVTELGELERFGFPTIPAVSMRGNCVQVIRWFGRFSQALELLSEAGDISRRAGHRYSEAFKCYGACELLRVKGDFEKAIEEGERGVDICKATEGWLFYPWVCGSLGSAQAQSSRTKAGIELLTDSLARFDDQGCLFGRIHLLPSLADAYYRAGDMKSALASAMETLDLATETRVIAYCPQVLETLGHIYSHPDQRDPDKAEAYFREALKAAEELGYRVVTAACHADLGRLHRSLKKNTEAREELTRACEMYREMDMIYYLRKAEQDLAVLG